MTRILACAAFGAAMLAAAVPQAQTNAIPTAEDEMLVRVDVTDVSDELSTQLEIGPDGLPRSVEVPIDVAAEVCEVTADQLMQVATVEQHVECKATMITEALSEATREQMAE